MSRYFCSSVHLPLIFKTRVSLSRQSILTVCCSPFKTGVIQILIAKKVFVTYCVMNLKKEMNLQKQPFRVSIEEAGSLEKHACVITMVAVSIVELQNLNVCD